MSKKYIIVIPSALVLLFSAAVQAEISVTATVASDYVFNGVSQSDGKPVLQGSADWYNESGYYVGAFISRVDYAPFGIPDTEVELDGYVGKTGSINNRLGYDLGFAYYSYPGTDDDGFETNYGEIYGALVVDQSTRLQLNFSNDYFFAVGKSVILKASHNIDLGSGFNLGLEASHTKLLDDDNGQDLYWYGSDSITHWGLSLGKSFDWVNVSLNYTDTDADSAFDPFGTADAKYFIKASTTFN